MEAHVAAGMGGIPDWPTVIGLYDNNVQTYTNQLRALEGYATKNPSAPDARFLMAYHYLIEGFNPQAIDQLGHVVKLAPKDKLASEMLQRLQGPVKQ